MFFSIHAEAPQDYAGASRSLAELPFPAALLDNDGHILLSNRQACRAAGVDEKAARGKLLWDTFWAPLRPGEAQKLRHAVQQAATGECLVRSGVDNCILFALGEPGQRSLLAVGVTKSADRELLGNGEQPQDDFRQLERIASHQLLQPLRGIHTTTQLLLRQADRSLDASSLEMLKTIQVAAHQMSNLLDDLSTFAEVVASPSKPFSSGPCLNEALRRLDPPFPGSALALRSSMPTVWADRDGLITVFEQLLRNALENRAPDRMLRVEVAARREAGWWVFKVADNGLGIDPRYHKFVFQLFSRLSSDGAGRRGLGLALCRRIVAGWAGRIWLEPTPGAGATLIFTVPSVPNHDGNGSVPPGS